MPAALFIGGYADGRWFDVPDQLSQKVVSELCDSDGITDRQPTKLRRVGREAQ